MSVTDIPYVYDQSSAFYCGLSLGILGTALLFTLVRMWADR